MKNKIKLIVADIDGCFTAGGRSDLDLDMVIKVAEYNRLSESDPNIPHLVFCTGRPLPYIQSLQQAIGSRLPSIAEFGAVMWCPDTQTHAIHPDYDHDDRRRYEDLVLEAESAFLGNQDSSVLIEAGKVCQLTLYPRVHVTMDDLIEETNPFVEKHRDYFTVDYTTNVLNFLPNGVNKGTALNWLAQETGISIHEMAGIGDSDCDWRFLERCAISAAPKNAKPDLIEKCDLALSGGPADCILELYDHVIDHNRSLTTADAR